MTVAYFAFCSVICTLYLSTQLSQCFKMRVLVQNFWKHTQYVYVTLEKTKLLQ